MNQREKQHHDRRMERMRLRKKKRQMRTSIIVTELLVLSLLFYIAYEMNENDRFNVKDITNQLNESVEEVINTEELDG